MTSTRHSPELCNIPFVASLLFLCVMVGCAGAPFRMSNYSDEELARIDLGTLCFHYSGHDGFDEKIKRELVRRDIFTAKEWQAIDEHKLFIGMSRDAFRCSWPRNPAILYDKDIQYASKEGPWGVREVIQYDKAGWLEAQTFEDTIPRPYPKRIYFENDVIVAFQEGDDVKKSNCFAIFSRNRECFEFEALESSNSSVVLMP